MGAWVPASHGFPSLHAKKEMLGTCYWKMRKGGMCVPTSPPIEKCQLKSRIWVVS